jgi:hypothetical protein
MATRGARRHLVSLSGPAGDPVPDGDGGWTTTPAALDPATWFVSIRRASQRDLERLTAGTVVSAASHILEGDYHPGVTRQTTIVYEGRTFFVNDVINVDERDTWMVVLCQEVVQ